MKLLINEILFMNENEQKKKLRQIVKMETPEILNVFEIHERLLHRNRQKYKENEKRELSYCALVQAIQIIRNNQEMLRTKNFQNLSLEEIEELSRNETKNLKTKERKKNTRERLARYLPIMLAWKKRGFSYRNIRDRLEDKYNESACLSTVYNVLKEIL